METKGVNPVKMGKLAAQGEHFWAVGGV